MFETEHKVSLKSTKNRSHRKLAKNVATTHYQFYHVDKSAELRSR